MKYEIALSFAGEDRKYVDEVANLLKSKNISFFYDLYETEHLWGKDLYQHLSEVYSKLAKYTIIFISKNYKEKLWTKHELRNAQARAFQESEEYILPAKFDDTELAGILPTVGYVDLRKLRPADFVEVIIKKLNLNIEISFKNKIIRSNEMQMERKALLTISDHTINSGTDIVFNLNHYKTFDQILDDLFIFYLHKFVDPFSYGSQWVLIGEPFNMRILTPLEWVINRNVALIELTPNWTKNVDLRSLGIFPGGILEINLLTSHEKIYGVLTNNNQIEQFLNKDAKAIAIIEEKQFIPSMIIQNQKHFNHQMVYRDWLNKSNSNFLIDTGKPLSNQTIETLERRNN